MAAANRALAKLSSGERQEMEAWLIEFEEQWSEGLLPSRARKIPSDSSWRLPALAEMVKVDLERQWQRGRQVSLESYLKHFPELGTPGDVSADLIQAEYEVRKQFGAVITFDDYARRFPHQAEELRRLIAQAVSLPPGSSRWRKSQRSGGDIAGQAAGSVPSPAGQQPRELPESFGRYQIVQRLGAGGMGSVYLAEDTELGRKVALKVAHLEASDSGEIIERFRREARSLASLDHQYLCKVHDFGVHEGVHYLTMAYVEGQSLAELIAGKGGLPPRQVAAILGKLALAMQEAHEKGVIHRDLKPSNIMIKRTGARREPVIVDFGLARNENVSERTLTKSNQVLGTPYYMAPEQIRGESGPSCDIYALGVILYELLTGVRPFDAPTPLSVIAQILTQTPAPPSTHRPDLDPRLEAICLKAMSKTPPERFATMGDLAAALTEFLGAPAVVSAPSPPSAPTPPAPPRLIDVAPPSAPRVGANTLVDQLFKQLGAESDPTAVRDPEPVASTSPAPAGTGRRARRTLIASAAVCAAFVLLGVIIYVSTDNGQIKIDIAGPMVEVRIDGKDVRVDGLGDPITLRAGDHTLTVKRNDIETQTKEFTVRRGNNPVLSVVYQPRAGSEAPSVAEHAPLRLPDGPPGSTLKHLGYVVPAPPESLPEIARYTNIAVIPARFDPSDALVAAAARAGLRIIIYFNKRDGMEEQISHLIRAYPDAIKGVSWGYPYDSGYHAEDVADFGRWLKQNFPEVRFGVGLRDRPDASQDEVPIPEEVEAIAVVLQGAIDPASVRSRVDERLPGWLAKAKGRPVALGWMPWGAKGPGPVPLCEPGTMRAVAEVAVERGLEGVYFGNYGTNPETGMVGLSAREELLDEIRQVARELGFDDYLQPGSIWTGEGTRKQGEQPDSDATFELIITKRLGDNFEGKIQRNSRNFIHDVTGTIRERRIEFTNADLGHKYAGTISGETMSLKYSGLARPSGQPISGTVDFRLRKSASGTAGSTTAAPEKPSAAMAIKPPGPDLLQPGSIWPGTYTRVAEGEPKVTNTTQLVVTKREGDQFEGRLEHGSFRQAVKGTIRGQEITWTSLDRGHEYKGTITGGTMSLTYAGIAVSNGRPVSGTVTLTHQK